MHVAFIPYGTRKEVELLLRDMESQKYFLQMSKNKKRQKIIIAGDIRLLPFGVYEYIFPKEHLNEVLTTLKCNVDDGDRYSLGKLKLSILRKMIKCDKIPKFNCKKKFPWYIDNVNIIPLGIREDGEITDPEGKCKGWTHEAL